MSVTEQSLDQPVKKPAWNKKITVIAAVVLLGAALLISQNYVYAPDVGQPGGPIEGLSTEQLRQFYATRELFKHDFTPEEGLGPLFNDRSCYACHGKPGAVGGEGKDVTQTGVIRIGMRIGAKKLDPLNEVITDLRQEDTDRLIELGGPAVQRKSVTAEFPGKFPADCVVEGGVVPPQAELISLRHAGPLFGLGMIDAIPQAAIAQNVFKEISMNNHMAGRLAGQEDPMTDRLKVGRFGWKAQQPNIALFTGEAMRAEMGITTYIQPFEKFGSPERNFPPCIRRLLPGQPNDIGINLIRLAYHQSLLAPPPRGPITEQVKRGEKVFEKLQCAVCHTPTMYTDMQVRVPNPDSPAPRILYWEIPALENKPVHAYSDFLLHQMGVGLADGIPQNGARGGEWRTTPLWGLRLKKFYLHDGRTRNLEEAITWHGGQAQESSDAYLKLPKNEREDLLSFLKSL
jgi:CxxC motif-containing protein (DUF1111 family)